MSEHGVVNTALESPGGLCTPISRSLMASTVEPSRKSPRGRIILPLHKSADALLQRMLNAVQPGSYIRPHRHTVDRAESIVVLAGAVLFLRFNNDGSVAETYELRSGTEVFGIDFEGGIWHSFLALEPDTVIFEVKPGPYHAAADKEFADWAPEEGTPEAEEYLAALCR